jgi:phenylacetate-CoA ligase
MNARRLSDLIFAIGRRRPTFPLRFLRRMPRGALLALRGPAVRETLRHAARAPYYREAFAKLGIAGPPRTLAALADFRLPSDVLKREPDRLVAGRPELAIESSGTSGHVSRVYLSRAELAYNARQGPLLFALWGLGRDDRLLCTLDLGWGLGALLVEHGMRDTPMFAMVPGRVDPEEAYRRLAVYGFNAVVSDPFWLARLTEVAQARGRPRPLKLLVGGGEGISPRLRAALEGYWRAPVRMTYASTEAATILGFECGHGGYHVDEFDFVVEIDEPDDAGYGEILLTTVHRRVMPLVRYRTGDVARWLPEPCACGLPFRRISTIAGRRDEQVSCAWGNVTPDFFEPLLTGLPGPVLDWQVALYERDLRPVFQFRLELDGDGDARTAAEHAVTSTLERLYPEAWLAYRQSLVDIEFSFLRPRSLRQRRKLLRLVDERGQGATGDLWPRN